MALGSDGKGEKERGREGERERERDFVEEQHLILQGHSRWLWFHHENVNRRMYSLDGHQHLV